MTTDCNTFDEAYDYMVDFVEKVESGKLPKASYMVIMAESVEKIESNHRLMGVLLVALGADKDEVKDWMGVLEGQYVG